MHNIPRLDRAARRRLIHRAKKAKDADTALRFIMIAKLGQGLSRQQVARDLACVPSTVVKAAKRFAESGEEGLLDQRAFNGIRKVDARFKKELERVLLSVPTEFGWQRTTWTSELLSRELEQRPLPRVAPCTMGRALYAIGARLGMPKPRVPCPWDSARRERVLARLRRLARNASRREPHRRYVLTPGQNRKRFVAGALIATTGKMTCVDAPTKASELFPKLVWKLLAEHRHARRIHLILDNYIIHSSKKTQRFLAQFGGRVVLHFLPPYCPDDNRIERVWLDLDANVTRNHRCRTMEELMVQVVASRAYNQRKKLNPSLKLAAGVPGSRSVV